MAIKSSDNQFGSLFQPTECFIGVETEEIFVSRTEFVEILEALDAISVSLLEILDEFVEILDEFD